MTPPRKRLTQNSDLKNYTGLIRYRDGRFAVQHPLTGKQGSLKTRNFEIAVKRWAALQVIWEKETGDQVTEKLVSRLAGLSAPKSRGRNLFLKDLLREWREDVLGYKVDSNGKLVLGKCRVLAQRGHRRGKPIAAPTRRDYGNDCLQLEAEESTRFPLSAPDIIDRTRELLSPWLDRPTHYNGLRNTLARIYAYAIQRGLLGKNPCRDIDKTIEPRRELLIPDEIYAAITNKLLVHRLNKRDFNGEWRAKICDLIYAISQQPIDVFGMQENQIKRYLETIDLDGRQVKVLGHISIARHKTGVGGHIYMNHFLRDLVDWFGEFKRQQHTISPSLLVYPNYMDMRSRGKPVSHRTMSNWWKEAREIAKKEIDFKHNYQLRDLRKKGLTDEALAAGKATNKGLHDSETMKNFYVIERPPKRAINTLTGIREQEE